MAYTIRGRTAQLRWGYQCAATLGSWTLEAGTLVATVLDVDTFRVSQSPLTLVVGRDVLPVDGLQIAGRTLTARVCPQELHPHVSIPPA